MIVRTPRSPLAAVRRGFTLLEVLVVVAILVILASLASFATVRYLEQTKRNEAKLKMQKIESAAKAYLSEYKEWPPSLDVLIAPTGDNLPPMLEGGPDAITDPWKRPFTAEVKQDESLSVRYVIYSEGSGTRITWPER